MVYSPAGPNLNSEVWLLRELPRVWPPRSDLSSHHINASNRE